MDKTWMSKSRVSSEYHQGVKGFLDFAFANISSDQIVCPCRRCVNSVLLTRDEVYEHLIINGIMKSYKIWYDHGESASSSNPNVEYQDEFSSHVHVQEMLQDAFGVPSNNMEDETTSTDPPPEGPNDEANQFYKLLEDANKELYPGCTKFTKLAFVVRLYHIKCLSGWSNKSLDLLLTLLKEAFPEGETLPNSFYEMKKIIKDLGLDYKKIDACPNDCMLYWKETAHDEICKVCGVSRWKQMQKNLGDNASSSVAKEKKIPEKVLRHFPLIPRLQRLFMSSKTAPLMIWHDRDRVKDGFLRHPADSTTWTDFDTKHKSFSSDHRNVRLGLAADGFNPFRTMSVSYSTWPVIVTVYNLPPWMCMKQPYLILSLLIPGPHGPGNDIDVYLQPLIDELKELWEFGVNTYDAHTNQTFQMKAALLWTISDFPGYAMLSGWSTKGRLACPYCNKDTCSRYLKHSRKFCYMGHRQFLDPEHEFRSDKKSFDGTVEFNVMPNQLSPTQILEQLEGFHNDFGKRKLSVTAKRRRLAKTESKDYYNWKKKSIFFELPYWKYNLVRHNLDVMHIEKNVCDNILGTLLNAVGKSKDTLKARLDLCEMQIRSNLHPIGVGNKTYVPPACYTMNTKERDKLCSVLKNVKVPDGYSSNISRCVNLKDHKIAGLKSHDCHVLMQQLMPIAIRGTLTKSIVATLVGLCSFFRELCSKKACAGNFDKLQSSIVRILCNLERIFPPAFFDVMIHLLVHLATEAKLAGPVQYRWMYPIERYLLTLKSYVRNRSRPEGSIAEGYLADECMTFCSRYFDGVDTRFHKPPRNDDFGDPIIGHSIGKSKTFTLNPIEWKQAHRYMLFNSESLDYYIEEHKRELKRKHRRISAYDLDKMHHQWFDEWIFHKCQNTKDSSLSVEVVNLAKGPDIVARRWNAYTINGFRFHVKDREQRRKTQNSGVVVVASTVSFASVSDKNPIKSDITYFGVLNNIIELNYHGWKRVVLFKCEWVDVTKGVKTDDLGFNLVNLNRLSNTGVNEYDEPFILASQALQAFYVEDPLDPNWHVAVQTKPRDFYDMQNDCSIEDHLQSIISNEASLEDNNFTNEENINWERQDMQGATIDEPFIPVSRDTSMTDTVEEFDEDSDKEI